MNCKIIKDRENGTVSKFWAFVISVLLVGSPIYIFLSKGSAASKAKVLKTEVESTNNSSESIYQNLEKEDVYRNLEKEDLEGDPELLEEKIKKWQKEGAKITMDADQYLTITVGISSRKPNKTGQSNQRPEMVKRVFEFKNPPKNIYIESVPETPLVNYAETK